jgi:hypothetical protein
LTDSRLVSLRPAGSRPAGAGPVRSWLAGTGLDSLGLVGIRRHFRGLAATGLDSLRVVGIGRHIPALAGAGRNSPELAGTGPFTRILSASAEQGRRILLSRARLVPGRKALVPRAAVAGALAGHRLKAVACGRRGGYLLLPLVGRLVWPPPEGNNAGLLDSRQLDGSGWLTTLPELGRRRDTAGPASRAALIGVGPARIGLALPGIAAVLHACWPW